MKTFNELVKENGFTLAERQQAVVEYYQSIARGNINEKGKLTMHEALTVVGLGIDSMNKCRRAIRDAEANGTLFEHELSQEKQEAVAKFISELAPVVKRIKDERVK